MIRTKSVKYLHHRKEFLSAHQIAAAVRDADLQQMCNTTPQARHRPNKER
jgi:hypothetical protein